MYGARNVLLRVFGAKIGRGVLIRPSARVTYPWKLEIGDYSWIGDDVQLYSLASIKVGSNSVVSQRSYLCGGTHDPYTIDFAISGSSIEVESEVWIASDVFVHPGVRIGRGAVVAARSTVVRDLEPGGIYSGTPAAFLKHRVRGGGRQDG